jgi:hypothetical protein
MNGIDMMSGSTKYCPKERISQDVVACYECDYWQNWSDDPNEVACCWFDWELRKELRLSDADLRK